MAKPEPELVACEINGRLAVAIIANGQLNAVWTVEAEAGAITAIYVVLNPDKLTGVARALGRPTEPPLHD